MAFGDNAQDYADCDNAIIKKYRLHPAPAQFTRMGSTSKWFRANVQQLLANRYNFNVWHTPYSGTRSSDFATAAAGAFPAAMDIVNKWLSYAYTDLAMFRASLKWSILTAVRTSNRKQAVYEVVNQLFGALNADFTEKLNSAVHMNSAAKMADVAAIYATAGTSYSSNRYAYIQIKNGSIGNFHKGMVLNTDATESLTVLDVIYGDNGPWSGGSQVADIGPGIVVDAGSGLTVDSSVDDAITRSGETTSDNFHGLVDWFTPGTNVYKDEDGNAVDRDAKEYAWTIPQIFTIAAAGSETTLDLDTHLRPVANTLPYRAEVGRRNREKGISVGSSMVAITTMEIVNEATQEASDSHQWNSAAMGSMDAARRKKLFGQVGFEGMVFHSATLGPISFQADKAAQPYKIRMLEPSTWHWLTLGKGSPNSPDVVNWIPSASGGKIHPVPDSDTTARLTFYVQCGAWVACLLYCDQPGANCEVTGVTHSL